MQIFCILQQTLIPNPLTINTTCKSPNKGAEIHKEIKIPNGQVHQKRTKIPTHKKPKTHQNPSTPKSSSVLNTNQPKPFLETHNHTQRKPSRFQHRRGQFIWNFQPINKTGDQIQHNRPSNYHLQPLFRTKPTIPRYNKLQTESEPQTKQIHYERHLDLGLYILLFFCLSCFNIGKNQKKKKRTVRKRKEERVKPSHHEPDTHKLQQIRNRPREAHENSKFFVLLLSFKI